MHWHFITGGQYDEALDYFDKALNIYWGKLPTNKAAEISKVVSAFFHLLLTLYLPFLKFRKTPTQRDTEVVDLFYKKIKALAIIDPMRFFFEYLYLYKGVTKFDLNKFELGLEIFTGASALFSFTGISFGLSGRILDSFNRRKFDHNAKMLIWNDLLNTIHNYLNGYWNAIKNYDDDLVNKSLENGEIYDAVLHLYWHGFVCIYQGNFDITESIVNKLNDIYEVYEHDISKHLNHELNINLLIERREFNSALNEVNSGIEFGKSADKYHLIEIYSCQAWIYILLGNIDAAETSLKQAEKFKNEAVAPVPFQLSSYRRSQLEYALYRLRQATNDGHKAGISKLRKSVVKSSKSMLKATKKVAQHRTEAYKLQGVYCWLIKNPDKALKWWQKAIEEGEQLGARLELSRTYFEIGRRLLDPKCKFKELKGVKAEEYLEKARSMFKEMDLKWDLDEIEKLAISL